MVPPAYRRALIHFHHIRSPKKRAFIRSEARRASLSGIYKIGNPGFLVVQGENHAVTKYIGDIKVSTC
jgi:hypothetical protein